LLRAETERRSVRGVRKAATRCGNRGAQVGERLRNGGTVLDYAGGAIETLREYGEALGGGGLMLEPRHQQKFDRRQHEGDAQQPAVALAVHGRAPAAAGTRRKVITNS